MGAVIGGHTVNRVGRKRLGVIAAILSVTLAVLTYFIPNLWLRVGFRWTTAFLGGISVAALVNLMLEQAPRFRGTAMFLSSAFAGVGTAIGIAVAGAALNLYINPTLGFQALGLAMGAFGFAAVFVILFFAKDPIKSSSTVIEPSGTSDS